MRPILFIALICSTLFSCKEIPESKFNKSGVLITSPKGWSITDEESFDEGFYLSIEKEGFDSSGIISFSWVDGNFDIQEYIEEYKNELNNNIIYKNSNLVFDPITTNEFNKIESYSCSFKFSLLGLEHEGTLHSFAEKDRTYIIFKQEAIEDKNKNQLGFKIIEQSFIIQ